MGASDKLMEGKSTFYIELEEAQSIISNASRNSVCLIDELGRGTSTFDGISIASSVLQYILEKIKAKVVFSTHYHSLIRDFSGFEKVELYFMDCRIEENEKLVHLYKLRKGKSKQSFAIHVAEVFSLINRVRLLGSLLRLLPMQRKKAKCSERSCN